MAKTTAKKAPAKVKAVKEKEQGFSVEHNFENVGNAGSQVTSIVTDADGKVVGVASNFIGGVFVDPESEEQQFINIQQKLDYESRVADEAYKKAKKAKS